MTKFIDISSLIEKQDLIVHSAQVLLDAVDAHVELYDPDTAAITKREIRRCLAELNKSVAGFLDCDRQ